MKSIESDTKAKLKTSSMDASVIMKNIEYSIIPKLDQSDVYKGVFELLKNNGAVGIFPEVILLL